jgi:outer membrane biosynthesis protein TonB
VEVDAKVKELEDEVKVLKAEIRNVLLDIREAILENTNPLSEQEPAYLRMDLNTTARALAAEEAARAMRDATDQAKGEEPTESEPEEPAAPEADVPPEPPPEEETEEATGEEPTESEAEEAEEATGEEPTESEAEESEASGDGGLPANGKGSLEAALRRSQLPPMQLAYMLPTGAVGGLAAWVTEAMATIGPQDLERVITIHRLWGSLPPNISYALAHLQRLIRSSQKADPPWLKIMQDMEKLASS